MIQFIGSYCTICIMKSLEEKDKSEQSEQTSEDKLVGKLLLAIIVKCHSVLYLISFVYIFYLHHGRGRQNRTNRADFET